nr:hypothetical protein DM860_014699 [Ipomoea batatas]
MEGIAAAIVEHDNKENIPPLSAENFIPKPSKTKLSKKRILRRPLRDITHLFNTPIQSNSPVSSPLLPPAASSNTRKRKLAETSENDCEFLPQSSSKVLRMHFR